MTFLSIDPSEIRFIHDTIHTRFRGGPSVGETLRDLKTGLMDIEELPPIHIVWCNNKLYSLNNRRLYVLKNLRECGYIKKAKVILVHEKIPRRKFTTLNDGRSVEFAEQNDEYNMIRVIEKWQCEDKQEELSEQNDEYNMIRFIEKWQCEDKQDECSPSFYEDKKFSYICDVCDKDFSSEHSREQHQTAKNHFQYRTGSNREQRDRQEYKDYYQYEKEYYESYEVIITIESIFYEDV